MFILYWLFLALSLWWCPGDHGAVSLVTLFSHHPSDSAGELSSVCGIHLKPQYILLWLIVCKVGGPQGGGAAGHIDRRTPLSFPPLRQGQTPRWDRLSSCQLQGLWSLMAWSDLFWRNLCWECLLFFLLLHFLQIRFVCPPVHSNWMFSLVLLTKHSPIGESVYEWNRVAKNNSYGEALAAKIPGLTNACMLFECNLFPTLYSLLNRREQSYQRRLDMVKSLSLSLRWPLPLCVVALLPLPPPPPSCVWTCVHCHQRQCGPPGSQLCSARFMQVALALPTLTPESRPSIGWRSWECEIGFCSPWALRAEHIGGETSGPQEVNFKKRARLFVWRGFSEVPSKVPQPLGSLRCCNESWKTCPPSLFPHPSLISLLPLWNDLGRSVTSTSWSCLEVEPRAKFVWPFIGLPWSTGGHVSHYGFICALNPNVCERVRSIHWPVVNL